ncbi:MAG: hydrolase [Candidatus Rokubacteria bacterium]|nr:hydrolase [Candidatus Rokubacteria bacterium]
MGKLALIVVDVQERLFAAMEADRRDEMIRNIKILVPVARRLGIPVLFTEQYPKGLGRTLPEVAALIDGEPPLEKTAFSCCGAAGFEERLAATGADHVLLTGVEAHVCVLLTALDLLRGGRRVSVVADAVCSRRRDNLDLGLAQARQAGAVITSTETVVFQLLGSADTDAFRELSKLLR